MIPAEAVEAAAKALATDRKAEHWFSEEEWEGIIADQYKEPYRRKARAALEAAAPHIAREAVAAELTELAEILEPFSGRVGLANTATRSEVAQWIRGRIAAVKNAKKVRWEAL